MAFANVVPESADRIWVWTDWDELDLIRQVPGSRWDTHEKRWWLVLSWGACQALRGVFGPRLAVGEELSAWAWDEHHLRVGPALLARDRVDPNRSLSLDSRLYNFQRAGVEYLIRAKDCLLADEMGTGKSVQALAAMRAIHETHWYPAALPALIVCPNSLKSHWEQHVLDWFPEAVPYNLTGTAAQRNKTLKSAAEDQKAVVIVNTEAVRTLSRLTGYGSIRLARCRDCDPKHGDPDLKPSRCEVHPKLLNQFEFRTCLLDEAHRIKDPKAKQTRAIWSLFHASSVQRRWALTGTPVANHLGDLWSTMHAVAPEDFPTRSKFIERYTLQSWNVFGAMTIRGIDPAHRDELFRFLDPRFRRMTKDRVLQQLPPKVRTVRYVEMSPKQRKAYQELEERLLTRLEDGTLLVAASNPVAGVRLMQLASAYCKIESVELDPADWKVELCNPSPKVDELVDILAELGHRDDNLHQATPVVVAAEHRQLIDLAAERLNKERIPYGTVTGLTTELDRGKALQDFQEGRSNLILFTHKAGGVGLNMSRASVMVRMQRSWSLVDNLQSEDRVHRIGSERHQSINIIDLVASDTVEQAQTARLHQKAARLEEVTRDQQRMEPTVDDFLGEP